MQNQERESISAYRPGFRIDARFHEMLMHDPESGPRLPQKTFLKLPEPVFPQYPEKLGDVRPDPRSVSSNGNLYRTRITPFILRRALRGWLYPYIRSRVSPGDFHPIVAFLFTEYKCNLDCHYCWAFNNQVKGMTESVARQSIDWLHDTGCRVLALMGGEVLFGRCSCTKSFTMPQNGASGFMSPPMAG